MNTKHIIPGLKLLRISFLALLFLCITGTRYTAEAQSLRSRLKIDYHRKADNSKILMGKLLIRQGRRYSPVEGLEVSFSATHNGELVLLGDALTDESGQAMLIISADYEMPMDSLNMSLFKGTFAGNDSCKAASSEIEIKDIDIEVHLGNKESKTITVSLTELSEEGEKVPVADEYISISIDRLFSRLPIGEGSTDENGVFEFVYEDEIPGDAKGDVIIIAQLSESDTYGTVESEQNANWGTPVDYTVDVSARTLWSDQAPLWMLIALTVVLGGAWFNFGLAIYYLRKMKKSTKNDIN